MEAFQAASELLAGGRDDLAEPLIKRGLAAEPDHPFGHALMALCHLRRDESAAAEREAAEAVKLGPDIPFCHYVLGMVRLASKRLPEAEAAAEAALDLDPEDESYLGLLGRIRLAQKRPQEALELVEQGLRVDPNDLNCLNLRIDALRHLGRNAEAQAAVRDILTRHPEDELSHLQAGLARSRVHDDDGARAHFGEALRLDPTNRGAAAAYEEGGSSLGVVLLGGVFAVVGGLLPWTNAAVTERCLRGLTWMLPVLAVAGVWGRRSRRARRLLLWGGVLAALLAGAWLALKAGRLVEARAALSAAALAALAPGVLSLRGR